VRISQVISILMSTAVFVIFSIRSAKRGVTHLHVLGWFFCLTRIALAFWMEFCITAETAVRNYTIMCLCLLFYMFVGLALYFDGNGEAEESEQPAAAAPAASAASTTVYPTAPQPAVRSSAPEDFRADIPIRTYNTLREDTGFDFGQETSGRYMVRIRIGEPGAKVRAAYPVTSRAVVSVRDNTIHLQDIFDLMGFDLDCTADYTAAVPDGFYHVTMCVVYPGGENTADPRNIYIYFVPQHTSGGDIPARHSSVDPAPRSAEPPADRPSRSRFTAH